MNTRLGIIGSGAIGTHHADIATRVGTQITACCDIEHHRARDLAGRYGAWSGTDAAELLARDDVDAVVVATPNEVHRDLAIQALRAGCDVLLEKPMATSVAACDAIIEAHEATDRILQLGFVCRYGEAVRMAKSYLDAGRFGTIYHAKAAIYRRRGIPGLGRWFTTRSASGGGVLIDLGVHIIDLALHLLGGPAIERVSGHTTSCFGAPIDRYVYNDMWAGPPDRSGVFDVDDGAVGLVRLAGGATLEINATWAANIPDDALTNGIVLFGDRGGCVIDIWNNTLRIATEDHGRLVDITPQMRGGDAWNAAWIVEHEIFRDAIASRIAPQATPADGRRVQSVLDALYESSRVGREVEVAS